MTETVLSELLKIREGLAVRLSLLRVDVVRYFQKDIAHIDRLIEQLREQDKASPSA